MGNRKRRGSRAQTPKFNFKDWSDVPIPLVTRTTRHMKEALATAGQENIDPRKALQPFMKHMVKEERKERDLVSTVATNRPIPIPGVELVPQDDYDRMYPLVYNKMPPTRVRVDFEPEVESLTEEEYDRMYPIAYDKMPSALIRTETGDDSDPEIEVELLPKKVYKKLYPSVYRGMPPERIEDLEEKLLRMHIHSEKRNPCVPVKKLTPKEINSYLKKSVLIREYIEPGKRSSTVLLTRLYPDKIKSSLKRSAANPIEDYIEPGKRDPLVLLERLELSEINVKT